MVHSKMPTTQTVIRNPYARIQAGGTDGRRPTSDRPTRFRVWEIGEVRSAAAKSAKKAGRAVEGGKWSPTPRRIFALSVQY